MFIGLSEVYQRIVCGLTSIRFEELKWGSVIFVRWPSSVEGQLSSYPTHIAE